jgi:hypothetical protein
MERSNQGKRWTDGPTLACDNKSAQGLVLPRLYDVKEHSALFGPSFKGIVHVTLYLDTVSFATMVFYVIVF